MSTCVTPTSLAAEDRTSGGVIKPPTMASECCKPMIAARRIPNICVGIGRDVSRLRLGDRAEGLLTQQHAIALHTSSLAKKGGAARFRFMHQGHWGCAQTCRKAVRNAGSSE